jgi:hypothetical protein
MHAGTCQVEGRVAGGGRGAGGALALWPGAHVLRERSPHPSSHHVLCMIVWCRLDCYTHRSHTDPRVRPAPVCVTLLSSAPFRGGRARACPPRRAPRRPRTAPHETHAGERRPRRHGGGGTFQARPRTCRVARRPLSAVARYVHKTSETSQWIIYTAKTKNAVHVTGYLVPTRPKATRAATLGHRRRACTVKVLHEIRMRRTRWRCLSWPGARLEP